MKQREQDRIMLRNQLLELERQYKRLIDDKDKTEKEAKDNEEANAKLLTSLSIELKELEEQLVMIQKKLKNVEEECYMQSKLLTDKDEELERLKHDYELLENKNYQGANEKRSLELEVNSLNQARISAERETDSLMLLNERLYGERTDLEIRTRDVLNETNTLARKIEEAERKLELAKRNVMQKETEIDSEARGKSLCSEKAINLNSLNTKLEDENKMLSIKVIELENSIARKQQQYNDSSTILSVRHKELDHASSGLNYSESKNVLMQKEFEQRQSENESLQRLLDQYRQDVDFQKNLREIESAKKLELEIEKRRLEQEAVSKDIEARSARRELEKVKGNHEQLLKGNWQINEELNALKDHAELLENQNTSLNNELENIVDTDQVVRKELDRKSRVEYIKDKNNSELQRSFTRLQNSRSPQRSIHNSPY